MTRFGLVGMGSMFHTFHLHGHRWIIPGPHGTTPTAQQFSPKDTPVSQFEDTRTFGPANSFLFTIDEPGRELHARRRPSPDQALGEWHMHCHVLDHMMSGMMGSLLIVHGGEFAGALPAVDRQRSQTPGGGGPPNEVHITTASTFGPPNMTVNAGRHRRLDLGPRNEAHRHLRHRRLGLGSPQGGPPLPEFSRRSRSRHLPLPLQCPPVDDRHDHGDVRFSHGAMSVHPVGVPPHRRGYRLVGRFLEACDCYAICPCWIDELPDEDRCTGLYVWDIAAAGARATT